MLLHLDFNSWAALGWDERLMLCTETQLCLLVVFVCVCAAPRNCVLNKDELQDGLRVLIPMDDKLLYAGHVNTVHSPDM